jgi:hypothetical protein
MKHFSFICFLLFCLHSLTSLANTREDADYIYDRFLFSLIKNQNTDWYLISYESYQRQLIVPNQESIAPLASWSCGPNAAARSINILGEVNICENCGNLNPSLYEEEYIRFAQSFPKSLGAPGTSLGSQMSLGAIFLGAGGLYSAVSQSNLYMVAAMGVLVSGMTPYLLGSMDKNFGFGNAGAAPEWYAQHIDSILQKQGWSAQHIYEDSFEDMLDIVKMDISQKKPVVALVVFGPFMWHYVTLIGIHKKDKKVMLLDSNGKLASMSFSQLSTLMNIGLLKDDAYSSLALAKLVGFVSYVGVYNIIRFQSQT